MVKKYVAIICRNEFENRYFAKVPDIPGCVTTGRTREEAVFNITDAATECVKVRIAVGIGVPEATPISYIENPFEEKVEIEIEI